MTNTYVSAADRASRARLHESSVGSVLSRAELRGLGWDSHAIDTEISAGRWAMHGRLAVALHNTDLAVEGLRRVATIEVGPRSALDGVTALLAAGLTGFTEDLVHVSVPHHTWAPTLSGIRVHRVHRLEDDLHPRHPWARPPVATVHGAQWARTDRQAALVLLMPVQQRLVTAAQLQEVATRPSVRRRRQLIRAVVRDLVDGAGSLGELDFARLCRERGLPEPSRQVVRRGRRGRIYLDVCWEDIGLSIEIDGIQHFLGLSPVTDLLRQNDLVLRREHGLRIPVIGLRVMPDPFMDQVVAAYRMAERERR